VETENTQQDNTESVEADAPEIGKEIETPPEKSDADSLYGDDSKSEPEADAKEESTDDKSEDDKSEPEKKEESESEDKDDSEKKEDDKKEEKSESEEYELVKPEDSLLSDADMERIASYAKEQGLSKDAAEKLVTDRDKAISDFHQNNLDNHKQLVDKWATECKDDKEIGGENYNESVVCAKNAIGRFATEAFKKQLNDTGFGNNPEVVRVFARIGRAMESDTLVKGGAAQSGSQRNPADVLFDKTKHN